jgi:2'-hydroxyisoflavone reductase
MDRSHSVLRRDFLKASAAAAGALVAGSFSPENLFGAIDENPPPRKLRLLILGGTGFIGPWMAELAVKRGHHVTLFNRGRREKYVGSTDGTEKLYGNRDPNLHAQSKVVDGKEIEDDSSPKGLTELEGKKWDAVLDNSGYVPRIVKASAELLAPNVGQYLFISTLSVYADNSRPGLDESGALETIDDPANEDIQRHYGALKALSEQAAEAAMPGRTTIVRPGYIVGPRDTTDRFTYWPVRTTRGGEMLVPGNSDDAVQFIDVRDLIDFTIRCVERQAFGVFNATGPKQKLAVSDLMTACREAATENGHKKVVKFTYVPYEWLAENGCPVGKLPILLPGEGETAGFHQRNVAKAIAAGLTYRTAADTCSTLVKWWPEAVKLREKVAGEINAERKAKGLPAAKQPPADLLRAGISPEEETKLLTAWHAKKQDK